MTLHVLKKFDLHEERANAESLFAEKQYDKASIAELVADGHRRIGVSGRHFEPQPIELNSRGSDILGRPDDNGLPQIVVSG